MERDMNLVREILLALEAHEHGHAPESLSIDGYSEDQIGFHVHLMGQAGLVRAIDAPTFGNPSPQALADSLTWEGYDFLERARNPTIWKRAMEKVAAAGAGVTIDIVKAVLLQVTRGSVGLPSD